MSNAVSRTQPQILADAAAQDGADLQRARSGSKALSIIAAIGATIAIGVLGYRHFTAGEESTDDAMVDADVVPIAVRVSGTVERVLVKDDSHVKKGELLLTLDSAELAARVKQAESELAAAKAEAPTADAQEQVIEAGAKGGLSTSQAKVSTSKAEVSSADAQIANA